MNIGVLGVQGDVAENVSATKAAMAKLGIKGTVRAVKTPEQISKLDGLIIPGGESTMIGQMSLVSGAIKTIKEKIQSGMPVFGICAGLILLSKNAKDRVVGKTNQPLLDLLDVRVERNSFGRQKDSFEAEVSAQPLGITKTKGVFIRAPSIEDIGKGVEIISKFNEKIVAVKQTNILATSFHPELTHDLSMHQYFVSMVAKKK
ncbi:pyridoxal 5'-phosphate synthase glutaminase subunit PdxT [Candidatus Nitrosotenuis uzonensis]|uniref:Pyridoxal 5'-phosphate synthase subunit PdxT n=1 Tax=Candidatus Nitrosotenuis uzonensis TaxID=1407055 RepID=A0A812F1W9_9ARCH|nr:pyridoxal 5'-phosphate synthase glutaminase subunit PdxT [Candidatus Nitrosotenuis uzonensis]CAE6495105.1 Pyridoxal 5'-phosphate synthase subunit PdxT [Candidatus Nitrosotenuis uzonensis]